MKTYFRLLAACILLISSAALALADPASVIAKARASVGSEAALTALQSVHYVGTLETDVAGAGGIIRPVKVKIDIIFQKPYRQRIVATSEQKIEITALDGYDGWQREQDPADSSRWRVTLLGKEQIKRLRANTWENLAFFKGIERQGGRVIDLGSATFDGKMTAKLSFAHDDEIAFTRYFDQASGRLLATETENGSLIKEEGEIIAGGLRFPRKIVTTTKLKEGGSRLVTITFETVTVNETLADSLFAVPSMIR